MSSNLYTQTNYNMQIPFLVSSFIREYDISKANINILYKYKILSKEQYEYYLKCPRMERQIAIGKMEERDPNITKIKAQGIQEARKMFFEANKIKDTEVLSIKNDAIFLINKNAEYTKFDNIEFVNRNIFTSFYRLNNNSLEVYYLNDPIMHYENIIVKGMKEEKLQLHKNYFLDFLLAVFESAELSSVDETIQLIADFNMQYTEGKLDAGYYRNFDNMSSYLINIGSRSYYLDFINENDKNNVNTICNMNIVRELWSYMGQIKFKYR